MNAQTIVQTLQNHKGQHLRVAWQRDCKTLKGAPRIQKRTVAHVRTGINYAKLATVSEAIARGERGPIQPIWNGAGEWKVFPFIVRHKKTGKEYVRMYPATFRNLKKPITCEFLLNGQPVSKEAIAPWLAASEFRTEPLTCFTVKAADVVCIG